MKNIKIQFKGITRDTDEGLCPDGESMELINAHISNGSLEPVGKPQLKKALTHTYTQIIQHSVAKRYLGISSGMVYSMSEDMSNETYLGVTGATNMQVIGNTVSISTTDAGIIYMIFRQGEYYLLGALPDLPEFTIDKQPSVIWEYTDKASPTSYGSYMKCLAKANKKGGYAHAGAFRAAIRLYDGSYVKHSHIRLLYLNTDDKITTGREPNQNNFQGRTELFPVESGLGGRVTYTNNEFQGDANKDIPEHMHQSGLLVFTPYFEFQQKDLDKLQAWSDIILSIDIFSTENMRHPYPYNISDDFTNKQEDACEEPHQVAKKMSRFYKVASIAIGKDAKSRVSTQGFDVSADNLAVQSELPDDVYTHNIREYAYMYTYNNKLHVWGMREHFMSWYNDNGVFYDNTKGKVGKECDMYVTIETNEKNVVLKKKILCPDIFGPYLMYPDAKAKSITIYCQSLNKHKTYALSPHDLLNLAYYLSTDEDSFVRPPEGAPMRYHGGLTMENMANWEDGPVTIQTTDNLGRTDNNILRVSKQNNPFIFPPEHTYQFNTDIVGVQSNTIAMSQGQFGSFPLYVFTGSGIFALSVNIGAGKEKVAYTTQVPVTRDVCNNPHSICAMDQAVAFSTDRGLMVIEGSQATLISESIEGFLPSCIDSSPVIQKILNIAGMAGKVSSVTFLDYLAQAKVGYNYQMKSLVVTNSLFPYSYVYELKTGMWYKISQAYEKFVNAYPYTYAMDNEAGTQIYDLNNLHRSVTKIALVTRAIKCDTLTHKRIVQTALRGIIKGAKSDIYLRGEPVMFRNERVDIFSDTGLYVLGSNDAEHFSLVAKKEMPKDIRDLVTKMNKTKPYKYFMVCLVGGIRTDVSINYIELVIDESFTNRLR